MNKEFVNYLRKTGKLGEAMALCLALGFRHTEIAVLFATSRQSVYQNIKSYKRKLKTLGEEVKFYEEKP